MATKSKTKAGKTKTARQKYSIDDPVYRQMADEYLRNGRNKTRAYLTVFPDTKYDTARSISPGVFANVSIKAYIEEREEEIKQKYQITQERVMQELSRLAFSDIRRLYNDDGTIKSPVDMDDDAAAAVASIETQELFDGRGVQRQHVGTTHRPKLHDKTGALRDAMKMLGMFEKDNKQKTDPVRELLEAINARGTGLPIKS